MKLKYIISIIALSKFVNIFGQDPVFSQFNFHQLYFNPAYAGNSPYARLVTGYRNQWPELGKSFVSYYISYDQYIYTLKSNFGLALNRDVQGGGIINSTSFDFLYSFPVEIGYSSYLSLGIQASIVQKSINGADAVLPDQNPFGTPVIQEPLTNRSKMFPDFSTGVAFYFKEQYLISFAVHHINRSNFKTSTGYIEVSPMQFIFQGLGEISLTNSRRSGKIFTMSPGIMAQIQGSMNHVSWGTNFQYRSFIYGLWCRNNLNFSLTTIILHLGYTNGAMNFVYSYDAWAPKNHQHFKNYGAHEVTFIYHFKYNDPKKRMKTIKCPKISR